MTFSLVVRSILSLVAVTQLTVATAGSTARPKSQQADSFGAISGVVRDAGTRQPIGGALVSVLSTANQVRVTPQLTDSRGRFVFIGLPAPLEYRVRVMRPGYLDGAYSRAGIKSALGDQIALKQAEWFSEADIDLWRTGSISGRLIDERGEPIVAAYVRVLRAYTIAGTTRFIPGQTARTDDRGQYRVANLETGEYVVMVPSIQSTLPIDDLSRAGPTPTPFIQHDGSSFGRIVQRYPEALGPGRAYPPAFYPDSLTLSDAMKITVDKAANVEGIDIRLQARPASTVRGVLATDEGAGSVLLRLTLNGNEDLGLGGDTATTRPDSKGQFEFQNVSPGEYTVEARTAISEFALKPAFTSSLGPTHALPSPARWRSTSSVDIVATPSLTVSYSTVSIGQPQAGYYSAKVPVAVGTDDVTGVTLTLMKAPDVRGTAVADEAFDVKHLPSAWQFILEPDMASVYQGMPSGQVRLQDGAFLIQGVLPGAYFLKANGLKDAFIKSIVSRGKDYTDAPLDVGPEGINDLEVRVTSKSARLSGAIQGVPLTGALVVYFPQNPDEWRHYGLRPGRMAVVHTSGGRYDIPRLRAGDYLVAALPIDKVSALETPEFLAKIAPFASRITLEWGADRTLDLEFRQW